MIRKKWVLNPVHPDQTILLGPAMTTAVRAKLKMLLFKNKDIFAWTPADMVGVPRDVAEHCLNVFPKAAFVIQH